MPSPSKSLNALRSQTLLIYHFYVMKAYELMYNYAVGPTNLAIALPGVSAQAQDRYHELQITHGSAFGLLAITDPSAIKVLEVKNFHDLHYIAVKTAIKAGLVTDKFNCSSSHTMMHPHDVIERYISRRLFGGRISDIDKTHLTELGVDVAFLQRLMSRKRTRRERSESDHFHYQYMCYLLLCYWLVILDDSMKLNKMNEFFQCNN